MSTKICKMILPEELSSEEKETTGPTEQMGENTSLLEKIAELEQEKVVMAPQLKCQQAFIFQLQPSKRECHQEM